ncbi:MAG: cobyrinate a,c-diamide synthase, partial [Parafilimonas terrae]|nr:cobyrinate a,c-diamide synthase [Parafilimonas terrae]
GVPAALGRSGSSADIAAALGWPVVLVHDASGQAQSAAAQIVGCARYDPRIAIAGVVLNRVGSDRHRRLVTAGLEPHGIPVLGALPRSDAVSLPERHLGLVQADETEDLDRKLDAMGDFITAHLDLDRILSLARPSPLDQPADRGAALPPPGQTIAVARDAAFTFIYPHVLDGWQRSGAEIRFFSPLADEAPPDDCDACWLPGGYPELHAGRVAAAERFMTGLRGFAETRLVHGECGGYMVLGRSLTGADGQVHSMAGLLSLRTSFAKRKLHLGYRDARLLEPGGLGPAGTRIRGHEFHYAQVIEPGEDPPLALVSDAHGGSPAAAGHRRGNVTGTFFHAVAAAQHRV